MPFSRSQSNRLRFERNRILLYYGNRKMIRKEKQIIYTKMRTFSNFLPNLNWIYYNWILFSKFFFAFVRFVWAIWILIYYTIYLMRCCNLLRKTVEGSFLPFPFPYLFSSPSLMFIVINVLLLDVLHSGTESHYVLYQNWWKPIIFIAMSFGSLEYLIPKFKSQVIFSFLL